MQTLRLKSDEEMYGRKTFQQEAGTTLPLTTRSVNFRGEHKNLRDESSIKNRDVVRTNENLDFTLKSRLKVFIKVLPTIQVDVIRRSTAG